MIGIYSPQPEEFTKVLNTILPPLYRTKVCYQSFTNTVGCWGMVQHHTVSVFLGTDIAKSFSSIVKQKYKQIVKSSKPDLYYIVASADKPYPIISRVIMLHRFKNFLPEDLEVFNWLATNIVTYEKIRNHGSVPCITKSTVTISGKKVSLSNEEGPAAFLALYQTPEEFLGD